MYFNSLKKMNLCIQNAEDNPVSIIFVFNHSDITHNGACVPTSRQHSYLPDFVDYYSGEVRPTYKTKDSKFYCNGAPSIVSGWRGLPKFDIRCASIG